MAEAKDFPPGTIGILTLEGVRSSEFWGYAMCVERPPGTHVLQTLGKDVVTAQNWLAERFEGAWLALWGDDHSFSASMLMDLLQHEVDIVAPLNVQRAKPFHPLVFLPECGRVDWAYLDGKRGLIPLAGVCGNAGMVIKRRVFEAMPKPWFQLGSEVPGCPYHSSDLVFQWKAQQLGFTIHLDTETVWGHSNYATFVPARMASGQWGVIMQCQGQRIAFFRLKGHEDMVLLEQKGLSGG